MKFLVVDDDLLIRTFFTNVLKKEEYTCYTAEDGQQALDLLKTTNVDVIITDINMPVVDGIQLAEKLKGLADPTPVYAMTAGSPTLISEEYPGLFKAVFSKMIGIETLFRKVLKLSKDQSNLEIN